MPGLQSVKYRTKPKGHFHRQERMANVWKVENLKMLKNNSVLLR